MADQPVTEFCIIKFKPDASVDQAGTPAHAAWLELLAGLKGTPGVRKVLFGRSMEDPERAVLCTGES